MCSTSTSDSEANGPSDSQAIAGHASALAAEVNAVLPAWIAHVVRRCCDQNQISIAGNQDVSGQIAEAGNRAVEDVGSRLTQLLELDIDEQWTNPLSIIRSASRYPTEILQSLNCPVANRDDYSRQANPNDIYDLAPASFADLGPTAGSLGITWGAAKAHIHLSRRKGDTR